MSQFSTELAATRMSRPRSEQAQGPNRMGGKLYIIVY